MIERDGDMLIVRDTWGDRLMWRFDGDGDVTVYRCNEVGTPLPCLHNDGSKRPAAVVIKSADMRILLERYKETL